MDIGKLRHRITLQEYTTTKDSYGAEIESWADKVSVFASIEPLSGREYFKAQQINAEVTTSITIRYISGVLPKMRIRLSDRYFEILSVINPEEKNRELRLMCREVL